MSYYPSFKKELNRLYTIRWIAQHTYEKEHISWKSKLEFRELVKNLDIKIPKIIQVADELKDLREPDQNFVLKPAKGSANRGVFPCIKSGRKWQSVFTNSIKTWSEIKKACAKADNVKPPYIIEEFIGDSLPDNWEVYCFKGQIGLIRQRRQIKGRNFDGREHKFWSMQWEDLGELENGKKYNHDLPKPKHPDKLLKVAKEVSLNIPFTFCRIDLFDADDVYLSELTHHPGPGNNFPDELDKKLGKMWLKAEARLL